MVQASPAKTGKKGVDEGVEDRPSQISEAILMQACLPWDSFSLLFPHSIRVLDRSGSSSSHTRHGRLHPIIISYSPCVQSRQDNQVPGQIFDLSTSLSFTTIVAIFSSSVPPL